MGKEEIQLKLPEFAGVMSKAQKSAYAEWLKLGEEIDNHAKRFLILPARDPNKETVTVDFKQAPPNVRKYVAKGIIEKKDAKDVEKRISLFRSLIGKRSGLRRKWDYLANRGQFGRPKGKGTDFFQLKETELLELFGKWKTVEEVTRVINKEWGYSCSLTRVRTFFSHNKEKINDLRTKYELSYDQLSITKKTNRIERLAYLVHELTEEFSESKKIGHSREIRALLDQVKKEVEGDVLKLQIDGQIDINATLSSNRSLRQLTQRVPINNIVVAMVAAKRGLNPVTMMAQFTHSFYKNHNGFSPFFDQSEDSSIKDLPSNIIYDWDEIERKHKGGKALSIEDAKIIEEPTGIEVKTKKDKLLEMLNKSKLSLSESESSVKRKIIE